MQVSTKYSTRSSNYNTNIVNNFIKQSNLKLNEVIIWHNSGENQTVILQEEGVGVRETGKSLLSSGIIMA